MPAFLDKHLTDTLLTRICWLSAILGVGLRVAVGWVDHGLYWPDEIYQSLEIAHRLVFGTGLFAWEYVEGARSWFFPALLTLPLGLSKLLGLTWPEAYLTVTRLFLLGGAVGTAFGVRALSTRLGAGPLGCTLALIVFLLAGPSIYFSHRALSETVSALPVVWGLALAMPAQASRRQRLVGAVVLALSVFLRLQNGLFCVGLVGVLFARRAYRPAAETFAALSVMALLLGLLDLFTWGSLFHSARVYLAFNVLADGASAWGVAGPGYYLEYFLRSTGLPLGVAFLALMMMGVRRAPGLFAILALFLAGHTVVGHKELRFLLPAFPLVGVMAGFGLEALGGSRPALARGALVLLFLSCAFSGARVFSMRMGDVGQYVDSRPQVPALHDAEDVNRLLMRAHRLPDVCGLKVESQHLAWTGGYTYFSRNVPLYARTGPARSSGKFNYVITRAGPPQPGEQARRGPHALVKIAEHCEPDPHYEQHL